MKMTNKLALIGMMSASCAWAQQVTTIQVPRPAANAPAPAVASQSSGSNAAIVSGGVGVDERDAMSAAVKNANLKMMFALNTGEYVSDVKVDITDAAGRKVAEHASRGPWVFANLPSGNYNVAATFDGRTQTRKVAVGKGVKVVDFRWPAQMDNVARSQIGAPGYAGETAAEAAAQRPNPPAITR
jgi:hypothetical protein